MGQEMDCSNKAISRFMLEIFMPFKFLILGQFTVGIVWAIDLSLRPYILKIIIDKLPTITRTTAVAALSAPVIFYLSMSLLITMTFRVYDVVWLKLNSPLKRHVGDILMKKMMAHTLTTLQNHFAGNLANKIKDVMNGIPDFLRLSVNKFFSHLLALFIAIPTVWTISYKFSMLLALWFVMFIVGSIAFSKRAKQLCTASAEMNSVIVGQIVDILSNMISVHLFATQTTESENLRLHFDNYVAADQKRDWWFLSIFAFQGLSFVLYQAICFVLLVQGFKNGVVTAGDFALLVSVNIAIADCLWSLSSDVQVFSEIIGNITQGLKIALSPIDILDKPNARTLKITHGCVIFDKVQFNYKSTPELFQNKSIIIEPGQKIGLVGYSGSGKSTFVNLILRLYDVTAGSISIDSQDIRDVTQNSLHNNIAMIPQDPSLFHRTLMENIRYGKNSATDEEVIIAAKRAHAHTFIEKLPNGYASLVGERGVKLSGGQRQRIAIARAILKNSPILILDEATSQLDSVTENDIQGSLRALMQNKTTLVIAHRLSTLLYMDRILVFDQGKIIEDGAHDELLVRNGMYRVLWNAQVGGFLPE